MNLERPRIPRIMIAGTHSGVGKSLIVTGLIVALRKEGLSVSCCVTGAAIHQALIYSRLSQRYSRILDRTLLEADQIIATLREAESGADIVIIDGTGGLYDGARPGEDFGSDADIARLTHTPVFVVTDALVYSNSLAAIARGFLDFSQGLLIGGIIANKMKQGEDLGLFSLNPQKDRMNEFLRAYGLPPVIAGIPDARLENQMPPRNVSQRENVTALSREFLLDAAKLVANHLDSSELLGIAEMAAPLPDVSADTEPRINRSRIAVSDDVCFNVAFQDNLALLARLGAEIVPFSPLTDNELPKRIGGLYLTGGYLDMYGAELARNERIRDSIRAFAQSGGVIYSEGAGTAYLAHSYQIESGGPDYPGVGLLEGDALRKENPSGVITVNLGDDSVLGAAGGQLKGITTGEWGFRAAPVGTMGSTLKVFRVNRGGEAPVLEGFSVSAQSVSTFHFLHFGSNPEVARALVDASMTKLATVKES